MKNLRSSPAPFLQEGAELRLQEVMPNPEGHIDRLFLVQGNVATGPSAKLTNADILPSPSSGGRLRIFHFNDLHNHLTDMSGPTAGTHRFSQMVKQVRDAEKTDSAVLFLSIGDDHTGSMLDELVGWSDTEFVLDPSYRAYSAAGVDASVLGNHEFDRGSALLAKGIRQDASFPILSANVHASEHLCLGSDYSPAAIAVVGGIRVGLIGLTTHIETRVGQQSDPNLAVASPVASLNNILPVLAPMVDIVLVMSHCGYGDGAHKSGKAAAARDIGEADFALAQQVADTTDKPVFILGAHTHTELNKDGLLDENIVGGVPIFQTGSNGQYLGEIDVTVQPEKTESVAINHVCLHAIKPYLKDTPQDMASQQPDDYDKPFETTVLAPILSKVATALAVKLTDVNTARLSFKQAVLARYTGESVLANFICDAILARLKSLGHDVDFALVNGATLQAGVETGPLTAGDWFEVMPYADEVFVVKVTGAQLHDMLQSNAQRTLRTEEIGQVDHTGFLPRGFFHTSAQLRYQIDESSSAAKASATDIMVLGERLESQRDRTFNVVMSTYLALGGFGERWNGMPISGGVAGNLAGYDLRKLPSQNTGLVFRDEIGAYLREGRDLDDGTVADVDARLVVNNISTLGVFDEHA